MIFVVVKSIDYDVDLDFLSTSPPVKSVNGDESGGGGALVPNDAPHRPLPAPSSYEVDCLITPNKPGTAVADRPAKVPSVDRSTKPSSAILNNSVADTALNSSQPAAALTQTSNKLIYDKNVDVPNSVSDAHTSNKPASAAVDRPNSVTNTHLPNKPGPVTVDPQNSMSDTHLSSKPGSAAVGPSTRSGIPPAAPDRSTKPVSAASSSSDVSAHAAKLEKEQAELSSIQAKKMHEAAALANLMREKRKLEQEMDKTKQQIDSQSKAE